MVASSPAAEGRPMAVKTRRRGRRYATFEGHSGDAHSLQTMTKNQTIRPVTVKQVNDASQLHPDSDYTIDGVEVGTVS